ncbi:MAG: T9SS type A sorting domain-containing protein [Bacteroidales bacterium]|nr:T9SS type A sorting domain-containing protein [Bacteroidales bacterium]MDZ4203385.1 T9SS type A sorting domain-containing protein [Bacteroidales bacterium]
MNRYFFSYLLLSSIVRLVSAQEVMTGLQENPSIKQYNLQGNPAFKSTQQALQLPFFDDFSATGIFPKSNLWSDNKVFINSDYAVFPPTVGVATFDAINEDGMLYPQANTTRFIADYLTSKPVRLDSVFSLQPRALTPADSIYLSFYYQPEGFGFAPNPGDSLVLEFYQDHPVDSLKKWVRMWSSPGMTLNSFYAQHGTYFAPVMIRITDSAYLRPGFRFRFYNYASILYPTAPSFQSNRDHWHLDYVYLNHDRNFNDRNFRDIAFAARPRSFLKKYFQMPYKQYKQNFVNEMLDTLRVVATNLHNAASPAKYRYTVKNTNGIHVKTYETGIYSFPPYAQSGYVTHQPIARPPVNFVFPTLNQPWAMFEIEHVLSSQASFPQSENDTLRFTQVFGDSYAYDDGTAEAGYGLNYAGGQLAYRFQLNTPDTLTAITMFFNRILGNPAPRYFHIKIWNDLGSKPNQVIYTQEYLQPIIEQGLNKFQKYEITNPVFVSNSNFPGLVFYIGWQQITSDLLNIGFDRNTNSKQNTFYNYGGEWLNSMLDGSLMMRPVIGSNGPSAISDPAHSNIFRIYPNPVYDNTLNLRYDDQYLEDGSIRIFGVMGNLLKENKLSPSIDISDLKAGVYVVQVINPAGAVLGTIRFVVAR